MAGIVITVGVDASGVQQGLRPVSNLTAALSGIQKQLEAMAAASSTASSQMIAGLGTIEQATKATARATQVMAQDMVKSIQQVERAQHSLSEGFGLIRSGIAQVTAILATLGVSVGLGQLVRGAIETAGGFEQLDTQLRFVVGTMEDFQRARQFILQFTATTPFQLQEVSKAFIDLTRRGFDVQRTLQAVGDAASLQRFPSQALDRVVFALGQIADRGKLAQQELNQLSEAGVPISRVREELAALGVSVAEDIGAAGISARQGIEAITQVLEKDFAGAMRVTEGNWVILVSNLTDTWNILVDTIVRGPLFDFLKGVAIVALDEMRASITDNGEAFRSFGQEAVDALKAVATQIAVLIDAFTSVLNAGQAVQNAIAEIERRGAALLSTIGAGVRDILGLTGSLAQVQQDLSQAWQASTKAMLGEAKAQQVVATGITRIDEAITKANAQRDAELAKNEQRIAQRRRQLAETVSGAGAAGGEAAKAAANAAKAEEQIIQQSLKRQEALIAQSFDARRAMADEFFADQIRQAPKEAEQINQARLQNARALAQEEATILEQVRVESNDRRLAAEINQLDKERAAHAGKVADIAKIEASLQSVYAEHAARQEDIFAKTAAVRQRLSKEVTDEEIRNIIRQDDLQTKAQEKALREAERAAEQQQRLLQRQMDEQQRAYERFSERVVSFLDDTFQRFLTGTLDAVDFFKNLLIRALSNIAANVIGPFITSISASIIGSIAGALGPSIGQSILKFAGLATGAGTSDGSGTGLLQGLGTGLGLIRQFTNLMPGANTSLNVLSDGATFAATAIADLVNAFRFGTGATTEAAIRLSTAMDAAIPGTPTAGAGATGAGATTAGTVLAVGGGLAAVGGGIYGALNASNNASKAAFAASAGAGAFAAASAAGLLTAAGVTAATTGWTGFGLIAAAVLAVIGTIMDTVIKPEGPTLAVGKVGGLAIGTQAGQLQVQGDLVSRVMRRDDVPAATVGATQRQLEEGITAAVGSIVQIINAVALDPAALAGVTQEALQSALNSVRPINSSNAKKMSQDITEQLRFVNAQIVAGLLGPLNEAFNQLRDSADVQQQLERLPGTTQGLVNLFKQMNEQLNEIAKSENTDVLRQLSAVRGQVELFGNRIAGTAAQVAESIVNSLTMTLEAVGTNLDLSLAEQITGFTAAMQESFQALEVLRATQEVLTQAGLSAEGIGPQMQRLRVAMEHAGTELAASIVTSLTQTLEAVATSLDQSLAEQITDFNLAMTESFRGLAELRALEGVLTQAGLSGAGIAAELQRLMMAMGDTAARIATAIVTTAVQDLEARQVQVQQQPLTVQATTVTSLLTDALVGLQTLQLEWQRLNEIGIDTSGIQAQFTRLLDAMLGTTQELLIQAFGAGDFAEFLRVLAAVPPALTALNPVFQQLQQIGAAFQQVVEPIAQTIAGLEDELRTTAERVIFTGDRITDLRSAIVAAGTAADAALPLYAQLAQALVANAEAQIVVINEMADNARTALQESLDQQREALEARIEAERKALEAWVDATTTALNDWVDAARTTADQLRSVNETILAETSPAAQRTELLGQRERLLGVIAAGGPDAQKALGELIRVDQQLLDLAKAGDNLKLQKDMIDELKLIQDVLRQQLDEQTGETDPFLASLKIQALQEQWLKAIAEYQRTRGEEIAAAEQTRVEEIAAAERIGLSNIQSWQEETVRVIKQELITQLQAINTALQTLFAAQDPAQVLLAYRCDGTAGRGADVAPAAESSEATPYDSLPGIDE